MAIQGMRHGYSKGLTVQKELLMGEIGGRGLRAQRRLNMVRESRMIGG